MRAKILPLLLSLLLAAAAPLRAAVNPSAPVTTRLPESGRVVVPAEFRDRAFVVEATINDRGPFRMLVDTGASLSLFTPAVAAAVQAKPLPVDGDTPVARNALNRVTEIQPALLDEIALGGARFQGVLAGVTDDLEMLRHITGQRIDGVLGFSLFSDVLLTLDFPGRRLVLNPVASWPADLPPVRAELPVDIQHEVPVIRGSFQGRDIGLLVDTGANDGLLLPPAWAQAAAWQTPLRPGLLVMALGEYTRELVGRLAGDLRLGDVTVDLPIAAVHPGNPAIGADLLKTFAVVFDQKRDRLWLCSPNAGPVGTPPAHSLGLSLLTDTYGWRVAGIIPGSPAEAAGIVPGDLVSTIENTLARDWSRERLENFIATHPTVTLGVEHNSEVRKLALDSWMLVP